MNDIIFKLLNNDKIEIINYDEELSLLWDIYNENNLGHLKSSYFSLKNSELKNYGKLRNKNKVRNSC